MIQFDQPLAMVDVEASITQKSMADGDQTAAKTLSGFPRRPLAEVMNGIALLLR